MGRPGRRSGRGRAAGLLLAAALGGGLAGAAGPARELLDRSREVNEAREPKGVEQTIRMRLFDSRGVERVRELRLRARREGGGERKSILFFLSPPEVRGVGLLAFAHPDRDDEQWLWLPELGRVRQVTARARRQSFQGSDFTYEDLDLLDELRDWTEANAAARLVEGPSAEGCESCAVIELVPAESEGLSYARIVLWLDREDWTTRKIELHDAAGAVAKRLLLSDWQRIDGVPTARRIEMATLARGTRTVLELSDVRWRADLPDEAFTQRALERGRPE